ncbi:prepilin-type N-terminal cleavage/methylation domain-containing protein [Reinekea forsetii]|nr:prepilin-type N-terminal cleavage/methylation domain-containing protein [Reinekea forsetii]
MTKLPRQTINGFTLIEVLVVILIMGVVMSMISLASQTKDPLEDTVKKAYGFQHWFSKSIDQSLLSGKDIGLYFTESNVQAMKWREGDPMEAEPDIVWEAHGQLSAFTIPEDLGIELFLDIDLSDWVELESDLQEEPEGKFLTPHVVVTPSEEYFPSYYIHFYDDGYSDEQMKIIADGFNRARVNREAR